jgi:hypothetical protein
LGTGKDVLRCTAASTSRDSPLRCHRCIRQRPRHPGRPSLQDVPDHRQ